MDSDGAKFSRERFWAKIWKERQKKKWSSYTQTRLYLQLQEMNQVTFILVIDLSQ